MSSDAATAVTYEMATGWVTEAACHALRAQVMIGPDPVSARQAFSIPEDAGVLIAIAYREADRSSDPAFRKREKKLRVSRAVDELVFTGVFGGPASLI